MTDELLRTDQVVDPGPLHVGFVVPGDLETTSGGYRYDRQVIDYLRARGDTVDVIAVPQRGYVRDLVDAFNPSIRERLDRDVDVLVLDGLCHQLVWRHTRTLTRPDAVVALVHHLRSDDPTARYRSLIRPFERRFLQSVDAVVTTSEFTRDRAAALAPSTVASPRLVAPPAGRVEGAATTPVAVRKRAKTGPLHVVFVGNVVPRKNLPTLLSALASLDMESTSLRDEIAEGISWEDGISNEDISAAERTDIDGGESLDPLDWQLTVVGRRDVAAAHAERAATRAAELGIADRVTFVDELSASALEATVASAHVCCVPASYEAFGMVHLEALEHGVVPVAGAVGGTTEFITDGVNGFVVDPTDVDVLADRLRVLATNRSTLASMGVSGLETAEKHPTWAETTHRLRDFFHSVSHGAEIGTNTAPVFEMDRFPSLPEAPDQHPAVRLLPDDRTVVEETDRAPSHSQADSESARQRSRTNSWTATDSWTATESWKTSDRR